MNEKSEKKDVDGDKNRGIPKFTKTLTEKEKKYIHKYLESLKNNK
jgi:hypothetical protein|tara:strand:+ start:1027 stop:1161 length:135 start_codon:yes stop_codon:yes gene_type:complete